MRRVLYHPARPMPDGRTVLALSPLEFLAALSRLIPPPRVHRHRYHGVLAPNARLRRQVAARSRWARLLARIYEVFPLRCPGCGADMRILAFLTRPQHVGPILRHLDPPASPPLLAPARGPPQPTLGFDADPDLDFDQTPA